MSDNEIEVGTKRGSDDYDEYGEIASYKRQRKENLSLRFLVQGKLCGKIIGKAGENIKRLRKEYSIQINVPDTRTKHRVLSISGSRDNCVSCIKDLLPGCIEAPFQVGTKDKIPCEINFLVQSDQIGALIGKGGGKIKEIRDDSNGKLKIYQDCLPNSNERVVAIGGEESEIIAAFDIVLDALREKPKKDQSRYYDPTNTGDIMGQGMIGGGNQMGLGGDLGGLGGLGLGGLFGQLGGAGGILGAGIANLFGQDGRGAADAMNGILGVGGADRGQSGGYSNQGSILGSGGADRGQSGGYSNQGGILGVGGADRGQSGGYSNQGSILGTGGADRGQSGGYSNQGGNAAGLLGQMNNSNSNRGNRERDNRDVNRDDDDRGDFGQMLTVTKITVTNDMCGAIIGKGGSRIRDIRQTSGARVDFTESEKGSKDDREITISGMQSQIQVAEQLMTQYVRNRNN